MICIVLNNHFDNGKQFLCYWITHSNFTRPRDEIRQWTAEKHHGKLHITAHGFYTTDGRRQKHTIMRGSDYPIDLLLTNLEDFTNNEDDDDKKRMKVIIIRSNYLL